MRIKRGVSRQFDASFRRPFAAILPNGERVCKFFLRLQTIFFDFSILRADDKTRKSAGRQALEEDAEFFYRKTSLVSTSKSCYLSRVDDEKRSTGRIVGLVASAKFPYFAPFEIRMKSFNEFSRFGSRRDDFWSSGQFSFDARRDEGEKEKPSVFSSFLNAFEDRWNVEGRRGLRKEEESVDSELNAGWSGCKGWSDSNDCADADAEDRAEFESLRRLAGDLANRAGRDETERRRRTADVFANPASDAATARSKRGDLERESVENAFRLDGPPDATATIDGKTYVYFGGDGYLGLQADPEMLATACEAAMKYGLASATSRRCFVPAPAREVERNAAEFFGVSRAFYALSEATLAEATLRLLAGSFDRVFVDEASAPFWTPLLEKCANERRRNADWERLERSERLKRLGARNVDGGDTETRRGGWDANDGTPILFRHCDPVDLAGKLRRYLPPGARPLVVTDGVFADCGSVAPLDEYAASLRRFPGAALAVNDSHGVGVLGKRGRGTLEYFGFDLSRVNETSQETEFEPRFDAEEFGDDAFGGAPRTANGRRGDVRVYMFASLAKAVGGFGCVAPGSELFVEKLTERCEELCGAIPSNPIAAATARGLRILTKAENLRVRLRENSERLRAGLRTLKLDVADSPTPIVSFQVGTPQNMRRIQRTLANERILISYLPARGDGARGALRVAVFATHTPEMIDALIEKLRAAL